MNKREYRDQNKSRDEIRTTTWQNHVDMRLPSISEGSIDAEE